jgi:hypothetical protein
MELAAASPLNMGLEAHTRIRPLGFILTTLLSFPAREESSQIQIDPEPVNRVSGN